MSAPDANGTPVTYPSQPSEASASRFTAVNGREPLPSAASNSSQSRRPSTEQQQHSYQRTTPPGQEKLTITTTNTKRENWQNTVNGGDSMGHNAPQHNYPPMSEPSHKRKRSGELDYNNESQPSSSTSYHRHSLPSLKPPGPQKASPDTPYPDSAQSSRRDPESAVRDPYATPQTAYPHYPDSGRDSGAASWYSQNVSDRQRMDQQHSAASQMSADDQLREALQRENQGDSQGHYSESSPAQDDRGVVTYQTPYGQIQQESKKRKRNFSNRTKTGCLTCRKRKKKCDEARPECNNCFRGGFVCTGYPTRSQWPNKPDPKQSPVPLQSKDGYESGSAQTPLQPPANLPDAYQQSPQPHGQPQRREPLPAYRGHQLRVDPLQPPARTDDDRLSASTMPSASLGSPDKRLSASAYTPINPFPTPVSAVSQASYADMRGNVTLPSMMDGNARDTGTPQSAQTSLPHINILHASHSNSPHPQTPQSAAQDAARLALSHPASNPRQRTQKEEMLAGNNFFPFDRELVLERERCNSALWRFNNSTNPNNGVLPEDRSRLFRDILQPREQINVVPRTTHLNPQGSVGDNCVVSAPFHCDYGYNIHIGHDVVIGRNCTVMDSVDVRIGDRVVIGPNVTILATTAPTDPIRRLGSKGTNIGKPVTIENDVFIGANVTILPGLTLRTGSTVGAGSVITRDVPPHCVVAGNPARVQRGMFNERAREEGSADR